MITNMIIFIHLHNKLPTHGNANTRHSFYLFFVLKNNHDDCTRSGNRNRIYAPFLHAYRTYFLRNRHVHFQTIVRRQNLLDKELYKLRDSSVHRVS